MTERFAIEPEGLATLCDQRAEGYGWLSRLFRSEVDEELLKGLKATQYQPGTGNAELDLGYRKIATYLSTKASGVLLDLAIDYVRTFIGHRNDTFGAAYPFESVYTSEKRLLMQEARNEVLAIYRKAGMSISESWKDPEDHIALELEYLQVMAQKAANLLREGDMDRAAASLEKQREFLDGRLRLWTPMLTEDMKRFAKTGLYEGLAYVLDGFLQLDSDFFVEVFA